jgi:hypothetical protein
MIVLHRLRVMALLFVTLVCSGVATVDAHRSGCHRWHSCPSDHGTYTCGDLGYCSQCPDNAHCLGGHPRAAAQPPKNPTAPPAAQAPDAPIQTVVVKRVVDGDTVELITGEKVCLIGVDTPETKDPRKPVQSFGKEATAFTKQLIEGKCIRLNQTI